MQVRITNVTDGVGKKPREVRVYNKRLLPGAYMDVPIQFVDGKVRKLEQSGNIVIGKLPPWYSDYEARRKVRNLTPDEITANVKVRKDLQKQEMQVVLQQESPKTDITIAAELPSTEELPKRSKR